MKTTAILVSLFCFILASCGSDDHNGGGNGQDGDYNLQEEIRKILNSTKATKNINPFDELGCEIYRTGPTSAEEPTNATIDYDLGDDYKEGVGSFKLKYSFSGKPMTSNPEYVYFEETWGDYRPDLSFYPLGLSIWVKGQKGNKGVFRFIIMEDEKQFSADKPHDSTRKRWQYYAFEDEEILSKEGWNRLVMPYSAFKLYKKGQGATADGLLLNRFEGFRIEIVNTKHEVCTGEVSIDALEQLTSYELKSGKPKFSSIFVQLNTAYVNEDWDKQFQDSRAIGIDTWIIQYAEQFTDGENTSISFYKNTNMPWITEKYDFVDQMFEAAERNGIKLIVGLYPGDYSKTNTASPEKYNLNLERNKMVFDELYEQFGNHPCLEGWYITEEFHDGSYPVGWQQEPSLSMLAKYLEGVASYIKTKSDKPVSIAPALWRGMQADLCGQWFGRIFAQTPNIDYLYLQDLGGRCLVDVDVDLPNWFAEIKKACDANGVHFGVDIESFQSCWCPNVPYREKNWSELKEQLFVAGLFTEYITNFSWVTFKKGTNNYTSYKKYLEDNGLL